MANGCRWAEGSILAFRIAETRRGSPRLGPRLGWRLGWGLGEREQGEEVGRQEVNGQEVGQEDREEDRRQEAGQESQLGPAVGAHPQQAELADSRAQMRWGVLRTEAGRD